MKRLSRRQPSIKKQSLSTTGQGLFFLCIPIITIPLALIVAVIYKLVLDRVIDSWECTLTTRALHVKKGMLNRIEKTVPLEKITDLQMTQGFVMRYFDLA